MKRTPTVFLRAVIVLIAVATLAFLLIEPNFEGVNAHATFFEIYFKDPFLTYVYIASIPFFIALYHAFKLLGLISDNAIFSQRSVKALELIKYCAIIMIPFIVIGVIWILSMPSDDRPPILAMGTITTLICIIVAAASGVFAKTLQHAVDMKTENELTV
jgi:hypothetical protein